jgi:hypothetical protein
LIAAATTADTQTNPLSKYVMWRSSHCGSCLAKAPEVPFRLDLVSEGAAGINFSTGQQRKQGCSLILGKT